jgi:uncharacterized protein (DUF1330 family)
MNKRTLLAWAVLACVLAGAYTLTRSGSAAQSAAAWPATKVALATAEQVELARQRFASGELEAVNQVQVAAEAAVAIRQLPLVAVVELADLERQLGFRLQKVLLLLLLLELVEQVVLVELVVQTVA